MCYPDYLLIDPKRWLAVSFPEICSFMLTTYLILTAEFATYSSSSSLRVPSRARFNLALVSCRNPGCEAGLHRPSARLYTFTHLFTPKDNSYVICNAFYCDDTRTPGADTNDV